MYSCCILTSRRRGVGGERPNLVGCYRCCIGNNRYATYCPLKCALARNEIAVFYELTQFKCFSFLKDL